MSYDDILQSMFNHDAFQRAQQAQDMADLIAESKRNNEILQTQFKELKEEVRELRQSNVELKEINIKLHKENKRLRIIFGILGCCGGVIITLGIMYIEHSIYG